MVMDKKPSGLDNLKIASPCSVSWSDMKGDERSRDCSSCRLRVYNLSAMTRAEAETLIAEKEGRPCVRFYRRADGTVITRDCPVGLRAARLKLARLAGAVAALVAVIAGGLGLRRQPRALMGEAAPMTTIMGGISSQRPSVTIGKPVRPNSTDDQ